MQAYAFAKLDFKGKNALFLGYIGTIAVPWQAYMVPQFMMMRSFNLNNTHLAIICSTGIFQHLEYSLMRQFYQSIPDELCEAARIDGMNEYQIYGKLMLPLSKPALSTLTIFTFVGTWNDFLGPMLYLTRDELKTIQIGLRMFIYTVFSRIWSYHGGISCYFDTCIDCILITTKILCRRYCINWYQRIR